MNALIVCLFLVASVSASTYTETAELPPYWYARLQLKDINEFSLAAVDNNGFGVTAYLNAGLVEYFDANNSLINCLNVQNCSVQDLSLVSGSYTLFIYNNHYLHTQEIDYTVIYITSIEEIVGYIVFIGVVIGIPLLLIGCLIGIIWCCRQYFVIGFYPAKHRSLPQEIELDTRA